MCSWIKFVFVEIKVFVGDRKMVLLGSVGNAEGDDTL